MPRYLSIATCVLLLIFVSAKKEKKVKEPPLPPTQEQAVQLYNEHQFDKALLIFEALQGQLNDEGQYYWALTLALKNKPIESAEALKPLLQKDPHYYSYKAAFDSDFSGVRDHPDFKSVIEATETNFLAIDEKTQDRLAATEDGLILLRRGVKIPLKKDPQTEFKCDFIDNDFLYYSWSKTSTHLEKDEVIETIESGLGLYSRQKGEGIDLYEGAGPISSTWKAVISQKMILIFQAPSDFYVYQIGGAFGKKLLGKFEGHIQSFTPESGAIIYNVVPKNQSKQLETHSLDVEGLF